MCPNRLEHLQRGNLALWGTGDQQDSLVEEKNVGETSDPQKSGCVVSEGSMVVCGGGEPCVNGEERENQGEMEQDGLCGEQEGETGFEVTGLCGDSEARWCLMEGR